MLTELNVQNLATLAAVNLELDRGLIAVTGDTGAGKSLILDALELALGARADAGLVRSGTERAQVTATFDVSQLPDALEWLAANELDDDTTVILRRTLTAEGRSKAFVNGTPLTNNQLKELADQLVFMHTQHANQQLLQSRHQLALVDAYADQGATRQSYENQFDAWRSAQNQLDQLKAETAKADAERELLTFQVEELNQLNLTDDEFEALDAEQRQLASGETFLTTVNQALGYLEGDETGSAVMQVEKIATDLTRLVPQHPQLSNAADLLTQAAISLTESRHEIQTARDQFDLDPERLHFVEERLASIFNLARKHKVEPQDLLSYHRTLTERLDGIAEANERIPALEQEVATRHAQLLDASKKLTSVREKAARELSSAISQLLPDLGMPHATLRIETVPHDSLMANGAETLRFQFQPNPGQAGGPLSKIASGGELSRVSLAIQVITAQQLATPTMVFDEVDVGIGGQTSARVGQLLSELAQNAQVLVVTHQPQVAGHADAHLHVQKQASADITVSEASLLTRDQRVSEIARMLGGHEITETTRTAAEELLVNQ